MDLLRVLWLGTLLMAGWAPIALAATPTANATSTTSTSGPSHSANCDNRSATRPVEVGVYVNKMQGVDFKDSKFLLDFYIWFRWKPDGPLKKYDPLATMELINGINKKESGVDRKTGDEMGDGQGN